MATARKTRASRKAASQNVNAVALTGSTAAFDFSFDASLAADAAAAAESNVGFDSLDNAAATAIALIESIDSADDASAAAAADAAADMAEKRAAVIAQLREMLSAATAARYEVERAKEKTATKPSKIVGNLCKWLRFNQKTRECDVTDAFIESLILCEVVSFNFMKRDIYAIEKVASKARVIANGFFSDSNADKRDHAIIDYIDTHVSSDTVTLDKTRVLRIFGHYGQPLTDAQVSSSRTSLCAVNLLRKVDRDTYAINRDHALFVIARDMRERGLTVAA